MRILSILTYHLKQINLMSECQFRLTKGKNTSRAINHVMKMLLDQSILVAFHATYLKPLRELHTKSLWKHLNARKYINSTYCLLLHPNREKTSSCARRQPGFSEFLGRRAIRGPLEINYF